MGARWCGSNALTPDPAPNAGRGSNSEHERASSFLLPPPNVGRGAGGEGVLPVLQRVLTHPRRYRILRLFAPVQERLNDWTVTVQPARGLPQERWWKTMA